MPDAEDAYHSQNQRGPDSFTVHAEDGYPFEVRIQGCSDGPRVIASHGNGLAIDAFAPFLEALGTTCQVVSFDMRGHGRGPPPGQLVDNWGTFVADVAVIFDGIRQQLGVRETWGAFHSLSSLATLLHTGRHGEPWSGLVVFEPPVHLPDGDPLLEPYREQHRQLSAHAAARRDAFSSVDELIERFRRAAGFSRLQHAALRRLAEATLRPRSDGNGYELRCPRAFEARTFDISVLEGSYDTITSIEVPVMVVAGVCEPPPAEPPLLAKIARQLAEDGGFSLAQMMGCTHFMQLEAPQRAADIVIDFIAACRRDAGGATQLRVSQI